MGPGLRPRAEPYARVIVMVVRSWCMVGRWSNPAPPCLRMLFVPPPQVSRILGPIVSCLEQLVVLYDKDQQIQHLIDTGYGGLEVLKKDILFDFFRSAFDGSGADNFFGAGRCD